MRTKLLGVLLLLTIVLGLFLTPPMAQKIPLWRFLVEKLYRLELNVYDFFMSSSPVYPPSSKILLVVIDRKSEKKLGMFPWKRGIHAKLVDKLTQKGASVIAFDVFFGGETDPKEDKEFVEAVKRSKRVVAVSFLQMGKGKQGDIIKPYKALYNFLEGVGLPLVSPDTDMVVRRVSVHFPHYPSEEPFFMTVVRRYENITSPLIFSSAKDRLTMGNISIPLEANYHMLINYCGVLYPKVSYIDVMEDKVPQEAIKGKIVIIASMLDPRDQFKTPRKIKTALGSTSILFGGEIHANAIQTVLERRFIYHLSDVKIWVVGIILTVIGFFVFLKFGYLKAIPLFLGEMLLFYGICQYLFVHRGVWVNYVIPSSMLVIFWISGFVYESKRVKGVLSLFIPEREVEKVVSRSVESLEEGVTKNVTVLFSDIRGYTTLSEKISPKEVMKLLNKYHQTLSDVIGKNHGFVFDYAGDGTLIVFGGTDDLKDHPYWALKSAIEMQEEMEGFNETLKAEGKPPIEIGIGICTGKAAIGVVGAKAHKKYTAIGDVVNTAARLQGLSKRLNSSIIVHENTLLSLSKEKKDLFSFVDLGFVKVKGKEKEIKIYGVFLKNEQDKEN